jgi:Mrp family chromosome partitioning ATPase
MMDDATPGDFAPYESEASDTDKADTTSFVFTGNLLAVTEPESIVAESIRALRGVLLTKHLKEGRRSLAICSPAAGAGCSFIAANLAVAMGQAGINTLLIDANLRAPSIQDYIRPSAPVKGLSECLREDTLSMGQVIRPIQPSLSVLYAGEPDVALQDQMGASVFNSIIQSCVRDFDLTIVDTPPSNSFADARRIASVARYALVVAGNRRSRVHDVQVLLDELQADRTTILGTYLNDY